MLSRTICLFINLFVCVIAYSQDTTVVVKPQSIVALTQTNKHPAALPSLSLSPNLIAIYPPKVINTLPAGYYYNSVGFFCQKELQVEKALKVPLKIRLGSVNYTDKLEGKNQHNVSFP
jgi:chorismate mutase